MTILEHSHLLKLVREDIAYALDQVGPNVRLETSIENITDSLDDWEYWNNLIEKWNNRGDSMPPPHPNFKSNRERK